MFAVAPIRLSCALDVHHGQVLRKPALLQLGVVAKGDHDADLNALPSRRGPVHEQDPVVDQLDLIRSGAPRADRLDQGLGQVKVSQRPTANATRGGVARGSVITDIQR